MFPLVFFFKKKTFFLQGIGGDGGFPRLSAVPALAAGVLVLAWQAWRFTALLRGRRFALEAASVFREMFAAVWSAPNAAGELTLFEFQDNLKIFSTPNTGNPATEEMHRMRSYQVIIGQKSGFSNIFGNKDIIFARTPSGACAWGGRASGRLGERPAPS